MNRMKGIVVAGTITALVLVTILALGFGSVQRGLASDTTAETVSADAAVTELDDPGGSDSLQAWQTYSDELEQAVFTLQQRDAAYQQQLEAANQTITELQDRINQANRAPLSSFFEEHEFGEHEEHRFGGFDD